MKFKIGDRVLYLYYVNSNTVREFTGTISHIKDSDTILVHFDEDNEIFHQGLEKDTSIKRYYWVTPNSIEPLVSDTKLNRVLYPDLTPDGKGNLL